MAKDHIPLPEASRPSQADEFIGQTKIWAPGSALRRLAENDAFHALILWGPPGVGKTSLARVISRMVQRPLVILSAVNAGVKDIRQVIAASQDAQAMGDKKTLLFLDEIHRLNKAQQDILLPALEQGDLKFIGATTENPSFEVNPAILSRCLTFRLERFSDDEMMQILKQAQSKDPQLAGRRLDEEALRLLASNADGDARQGLNLLDAVGQALAPGEAITTDALGQFAGQILRKYDKQGEYHYDVISAFIKSVRASHPDAALYYLARMIDGGEDPVFIARRLIILASEDVGNANPTALLVATSGMQAVAAIGYPEARIILSQVTTYLAASAKSNRSYLAIDKALADVRETQGLEVPMHLRNAPTKFMKATGYGKGYIYAHDDPEGSRRIPYLPQALKGRRYYEPADIGSERQIRDILAKIRPTADD